METTGALIHLPHTGSQLAEPALGVCSTNTRHQQKGIIMNALQRISIIISIALTCSNRVFILPSSCRFHVIHLTTLNTISLLKG